MPVRKTYCSYAVVNPNLMLTIPIVLVSRVLVEVSGAALLAHHVLADRGPPWEPIESP